MALVTASRFRTLSYVEAASFMLLLFVAMPLKYWAGIPLAVTIVGSAHGAIFVAYLVFTGLAAWRLKWNLWQVLGAFAAAVLPFGPFVFDRLVLAKRSPAT
jgi:integral membrane protein